MTLEDRLRFFDGCGYARQPVPSRPAARPASPAAGAPAPAPDPMLADVRFWAGLGAGIGGTVALLWLVILGAWVLA